MVLPDPWNAVASWVESSSRLVCLDVDVGNDDVVVENHIDLGVVAGTVLASESLCGCENYTYGCLGADLLEPGCIGYI